ncbi:hypothetical protein BN1723_016934, partial [Verticillium longisporum]
MYFSATIFRLVGFHTPTLTALSVAVTNFVFTVAALLLIDKIGRRRIMLYSLPFMIAGLLLAAYGFSFLDLAPSTERLRPRVVRLCGPGTVVSPDHWADQSRRAQGDLVHVGLARVAYEFLHISQ